MGLPRFLKKSFDYVCKQTKNILGGISKAEPCEDDSKPENEPIKRHNYFSQFLDIILQNENVPKNILLVGLKSTDKSSFINLIKSAVLKSEDDMDQPCDIDYEEFSQFIQHVARYENMGLTETEVEHLVKRMEKSRKNIPNNFRLPTLIDIIEIENYSELALDFVLDGIIPENANSFSRMSLDCLSAKNFSQQMETCIDHIVFVASFEQDVPQQLIKTVFNLGYRKRGIPFSLVMTHKDCSGISPTTAKDRRKLIESILCISKDSRGVTHCISNYCDLDQADPERPQADEVNYEKHKDVLIAMLNMVRPRQPRLPCRKRSVLQIQLQLIIGILQEFAERQEIPVKGLGLTVLMVFLSLIALIRISFLGS